MISLEETICSVKVLEFTLDYPRTKSGFKDLSSDKQSLLYYSLVDKISARLSFKHRIIQVRLEKCKSGDVHLHGMLQIDGIYSIEGMVTEFAQATLKSIDGRMKFDRGTYLSKYYRYVSPCVCVQYTDDQNRVKEWHDYMNKSYDSGPDESSIRVDPIGSRS